MSQSAQTFPVAKDAVPSILRSHGIQATAQRVEIAAILLAAKQHLSADQVLTSVNNSGGPVSKATVYNTLGLFAERGLVRQVIVDSTKVFYDSNTAPHYHFYNVDDGALMDVEADLVPIEQLPSAPEGTFADGVDIVIRIRNQHG
ncbi:MAG: Fur family transcriptional regulator [Gammaproteobacteria bacterium]